MESSVDLDDARTQVVAPSPPRVEAVAPVAPVPLPSHALVVGHAEDRVESDADRMAEAALHRLARDGVSNDRADDGDTHRHVPGLGHLRRSADPPGAEALLGREGGALDGDTSAAIDSKRGSGRTLAAPVLERMQTAFSADFSRVRIHDDADSARLNRMVSARAFTTGNDIFFGAGEYAPSTAGGERVLAHELAHTLQPSAVAPTTQDARRRTVGRHTIRRAGDKVAFDKVPHDALGGEDAELSGLIETAIAAHKDLKAQRKQVIEDTKDAEIDTVNSRGLTKDLATAQRVGVLKRWYAAYQQTGWSVENLKREILAATANRVTFDETDRACIGIVATTSGSRLFNIVGGDARFTSNGGRVAVKKGTTKEYLRDARGVYISRFVHRGCSIEQMQQLFSKKVMLPRNESTQIGSQREKFQFDRDRDEHGRITPEERDFLQQRDGSGKNQRMLSVTHTKPSRKVHSNHGELFGSEAIIKIDLSLVPQEDIFNLHSVETHDDKVSLPQIRTDEKDPNIKTVVPKEKELESYVYSAEKNRETVLLRIPVTAVVSVHTPDGKTVGLEEARKAYNQYYATEERLKREEQERATEQERLDKERQARAREKTEGAKVKKQESENRADLIKDKVEELARDLKNKKLAKWREFDLYEALAKTKSTAWQDIVAGTDVENITVEQAKKILEKAESL